MKHVFHAPYAYGDILYLKTDPEQRQRIAVGFKFRPNSTEVLLACSTCTPTWHTLPEISGHVDQAQQLGYDVNKN